MHSLQFKVLCNLTPEYEVIPSKSRVVLPHLGKYRVVNTGTSTPIYPEPFFVTPLPKKGGLVVPLPKFLL